MYFIALVFPPLAILMCGKPFQAMLSVPFSLFYFPGALWAILVVSDHKASKRTQYAVRVFDVNSARQVDAIDRQTAEMKRIARDQAKQQAIAAKELARQQALAAPVVSPAALPPQAASSTQPVVQQIPVAPRKPLVTVAQVRAALTNAKSGVVVARSSAIAAYRELPEWAQPITWGLAAASPVSVAIAIFSLAR